MGQRAQSLTVPYQWTKKIDEAPDKTGAFSFGDGTLPIARLELWPHQSLSSLGFVWFIAPTALLFLIPLIAVLGTPVLWVLLLFFIGAVSAMWLAISVNKRQRRIEETLLLWPDKVILRHLKVGRSPLEWEANPFWVEINLTESGGPVDQYLTLRGQDRTVEIGSFLTVDERVALRRELATTFAMARNAG